MFIRDIYCWCPWTGRRKHILQCPIKFLSISFLSSPPIHTTSSSEIFILLERNMSLFSHLAQLASWAATQHFYLSQPQWEKSPCSISPIRYNLAVARHHQKPNQLGPCLITLRKVMTLTMFFFVCSPIPILFFSGGMPVFPAKQTKLSQILYRWWECTHLCDFQVSIFLMAVSRNGPGLLILFVLQLQPTVFAYLQMNRWVKSFCVSWCNVQRNFM